MASTISTPGMTGVFREVALEERLVDRHALDADDGLALAVFLGAVDQQEGIAVRDPFQDLGDVDGRCRLRPCRWSFLRSLPRLADLESQATSSSSGEQVVAGTPPQVSPAGMSRKTPAAAATWAPSPIVTWSATPPGRRTPPPSPIDDAAGDARVSSQRRSFVPRARCGRSAPGCRSWCSRRSPCRRRRRGRCRCWRRR